MKRIVLSTALIAISAFGSIAQAGSPPLSAALQSQIMRLVPSADLSNLTNAQYVQLVTLFSNSDDIGAGDNPAGAVKAILKAQ